MISQTRFEQEFSKMINLCGLIVKKEAIGMYFDKLKNWDEEAVFKGMDHIVEDPPNKLTLSVFKSHIRQTKVGRAVEDWTGRVCSDERCNRGLISIKIKNNTLFRCTKCNSSKLMFIADFTEQNVEKEKQKQARIN